ncbi:hypothetical protein [Lacisediminihabitans profunda]|uniref:hypothetical protein n=1 Tax=Lacisediminihabitans profunda TaxID=2594790 RepID=UPI00164FD211|nr:hypothetical protein [Lacisediminihabitans profunda]
MSVRSLRGVPVMFRRAESSSFSLIERFQYHSVRRFGSGEIDSVREHPARTPVAASPATAIVPDMNLRRDKLSIRFPTLIIEHA